MYGSYGAGGSYSSYTQNNSFNSSYNNNQNNNSKNSNNPAFGSNLYQIDWTKEDLIPFRKDFYNPHPDILNMTEQETIDFRKKNFMTIEGDRVPRPVRTFQEAGFDKYILDEVANAGFTNPTPIQCQGWPMALSGRDVIGVAETGSGKTLSFLLPAIVHINAQPLLRKGDGPIVLCLCPTRELACQIKEQCDKFGYTSRIKNTCLYGGVPKTQQQRDLDTGIEIAIATPGRLIDFLNEGRTNLKRVTYLVLDEADRMLVYSYVFSDNFIIRIWDLNLKSEKF